MTDGSASHPASREWPPERLAEMRRGELIEAIEILGGGAADLTWLGHPDSRLHEVSAADILPPLTAAIDGQAARHVFVPAREDKHCDHQTTAQLAEALRAQRPNLHFHSYPVWSRFDDPNFAAKTAGYAPSPSTPPPTVGPKLPRSGRIAASLDRSCKTTPRVCPARCDDRPFRAAR